MMTQPAFNRYIKVTHNKTVHLQCLSIKLLNCVLNISYCQRIRKSFPEQIKCEHAHSFFQLLMFDVSCILVPRGQTVNQEFYLPILQYLIEAAQEVTGTLDDTWFLHHNTLAYMMLAIDNSSQKTQLQCFHSHPIVLTLFNRLTPVPKTRAANP